MAIKVDSTDPSAPAAVSCNRWQQLWQRLSVRFVLLLGIAVFGVAVGIDSLQQASAADLIPSFSGPSAPPRASVQPSLTSAPSSAMAAKNYLEFDAGTAQRLRYSDLTQASLTGSRLTRAHLFTQPAG